MDKIKVFLSSRVNTPFKSSFNGLTLADLRKYLKEELEKEELLGQKGFKVIINEDSFEDASMDENWFQKCLSEMRGSHIIIVLYNGEAGWSESGKRTLGICHEEYIIAASEFAGMSYAIDLTTHFDLQVSDAIAKKNEDFQSTVQASSLFRETVVAEEAEALKEEVLQKVKVRTKAMINRSVETQKAFSASSNTFKSTLNWSKLNYAERIDQLEKAMKRNLIGLDGMTDVIKVYHAIPDHMSVADARNRIDRPFLEEHLLLTKKAYQGLKMGVIHYVGVYGSATEIQAKNLVGYPDLTVIKAPFGFYLWDKVRHIQIFFLSKCINTETVKRKLREINMWVEESDELENIRKRALARYQIILRIKEMQQYS